MSYDGYDYTFFAYDNFLPAKWTKALGGNQTKWAGCEDWYGCFPLIVWFEREQAKNDSKAILKLQAQVGPIKNYEFRKELIGRIKEISEKKNSSQIRFDKNADAKGKKYSSFFDEEKGQVSLANGNNVDDLISAMTKLLSDFRPTFDAIAEILPEFAQYAEKE